MCGFAGILAQDGLSPSDESALGAMAAQIAHRGPDDEGAWFDSSAGVALVHRRLAIIDISSAGHQPMHAASGRYVVAYNGEIYNFEELRRRLEGEGKAPEWRGHSDTEVLLASVEAWGVEVTLRRVAGMFALALWDRRDRRLTLARDRMGEKPLYYGWQGKGSQRRFLFGSDLAALRAHPAFEGDVDRAAIAQLCRYLYIPEPHSIFRGIGKLAPGAFLVVDPASGREERGTYFDLIETAAQARADPFTGSADAAVDLLGEVLGQAVERQMVSDVPLGAFLSGGIDSTTIVALMQAASPRPIKTFTIGFAEHRFDEAGHARMVARHLGTEHHELSITPSDAFDVIAKLPEIYSEPFADSSQIPTYLVSRLARAHVKVALSGDAGDELFGGYNRHLFAHRRWPALARTPRHLRSAIGRAILAVSPAAWDRTIGPLLAGRVAQLGDKMHKSASVIASASFEELYDGLISINRDRDGLVRGESAAGPQSVEGSERIARWAAPERMMALDALGYLPGDILAKIDRAAMAVSLETRVPFLDPDVVRLAWSLPLGIRMKDGITKWPLRRLLDRFVPRAMVERPKMGFAIPLGDWLKGPLRGWTESLLERSAVERFDVFEPAAVDRLWRDHLRGARNNEHRLWPVLMTQAWLAANGEQSRSSQIPLRRAFG